MPNGLLIGAVRQSAGHRASALTRTRSATDPQGFHDHGPLGGDACSKGPGKMRPVSALA